MTPANHLMGIFFLLALLMGCSEQPGCREDHFTPKTIQTLAAIQTPEALLLASALSQWEFVQDKDPGIDLPKPEFLREQALRLAPNDEMVLAFVGNACSSSNPSNPSEDAPLCSRAGAKRLTDLNPDNAFYWAKLAHYELAERDIAAALKSYQQASASPEFSIGWGEQIYRFSTALQDALHTDGSCAALTAVSIASGSLPPFQDFTKTCRAHSSDNDWREACSDLGRKMETQALTVISRSIGFSLQRMVYEASEDETGVAHLNARQERFDAMRGRHNAADECIRTDPNWANQWVLGLRDFGEAETMRRMSDAAPNC